MAQSRLERIGTIYTRVQSLLRGKAMAEVDKPVWYVIYEAFPPKEAPTYRRPAPDVPINNLVYEEDHFRAKFHKECKGAQLLLNLNKQHSGLIGHTGWSYVTEKTKNGIDSKAAEEQVLEELKAVLKDLSKPSPNVK